MDFPVRLTWVSLTESHVALYKKPNTSALCSSYIHLPPKSQQYHKNIRVFVQMIISLSIYLILNFPHRTFLDYSNI